MSNYFIISRSLVGEAKISAIETDLFSSNGSIVIRVLAKVLFEVISRVLSSNYSIHQRRVIDARRVWSKIDAHWNCEAIHNLLDIFIKSYFFIAMMAITITMSREAIATR